MRRAPALAVAAALALPPACEPVPDLTFAQAADAADGGDDSATDAGCPESPPPGASICCGTVPCEGLCSAVCDMCASRCLPGETCCAKTNNVVCIAAGAICH